MGIEAMAHHVVPFTAALSRLAGIFLAAPALASPTIPRRVRLLMALGMTLVVYPTLSASDLFAQEPTLATLVPIAVSEAMIGLTVGFLASVPLIGAQLGGLLMGQQMGLALGQVFNPAIGGQGDILGQVIFYLALAAFLTIGGLEITFVALVETFDRVPVGGFGAGMAPPALLAGVFNSGFDLAVRVAAPVVGLILLETIATGVLMKTVPQLNILTFGFPMKILAGFSALVAAIAAIDAAIRHNMNDVLAMLMEWARSL